MTGQTRARSIVVLGTVTCPRPAYDADERLAKVADLIVAAAGRRAQAQAGTRRRASRAG